MFIFVPKPLEHHVLNSLNYAESPKLCRHQFSFPIHHVCSASHLCTFDVINSHPISDNPLSPIQCNLQTHKECTLLFWICKLSLQLILFLLERNRFSQLLRNRYTYGCSCDYAMINFLKSDNCYSATCWHLVSRGLLASHCLDTCEFWELCLTSTTIVNSRVGQMTKPPWLQIAL